MILREYRRASATAIDALKPLSRPGPPRRPRAGPARAQFGGELMAATSFGGVMRVGDLAERPIYSARSGPSMAPVARPRIRRRAGGSSRCHRLRHQCWDVVRREPRAQRRDRLHQGRLARRHHSGHLTGLASVDAQHRGERRIDRLVDPGGLLRVGPRSSAPTRSAAYSRGGTTPTVTDAATVLSYLSGHVPRRPDATRRRRGPRRRRQAGTELDLDTEACAAAIFAIANRLLWSGAIRS
ncbi:hypothetical protein HBB16_17625 [Pseudonocardia sp. MCCB 268]|nr:hypothetical protein [Pseudonocardia cytotoxica]